MQDIYNKGLELAASERFSEAIPLLSKSIKLWPKNPELHTAIAMSYMGIGENRKAEKAIKKSIKLNNSGSVSFLIASDLYKRSNNLDMSEYYIKKALSVSPDNPAVLAFYATLMTQKGESDKAIEYAEKAQKIDPSRELDCAILISTIRKAKSNSKHFKVLKEQFSEELPEKKLIPAAFALGKCYDETGDYDQAFKHYEMANNHKHAQLILNKTNHNPENHTAYCKAIKELMPIESVKNYKGGNQSTDPIFILGMPRSGTTLVEQIITSREVIAGGEIPHFSKIGHKFDYPEQDFHNHGFAFYGKKYLDKTGLRGQRFTDKMPNNFHFVGLIRCCFPNAKIIHVKRNPYDTCLSNYFANFSQLNFTNDLKHLAQYYNDYSDIMNHWRECVDFYELEYENLINDQEAETRKLIEYCDLEWHDDYLAHHKNKAKVATASLSQVREPIYKTSISKHEHYRDYLSDLYELIER